MEVCTSKKDHLETITLVIYGLLTFHYFGFQNVLTDVVPMAAKLFPVVLYAGLGYRILVLKYSKKEWIVCGILLLLGAINLYTIRDVSLLWNAVVFMSMKDMDVEKVMKPVFCGSLAGILLSIGCSCTGICGPLYMVREYRPGRGEELRYAFGFDHPNHFHKHVVSMTCWGIGAYCRKWRGWLLILLAGFNLLMYHYTDSRAGILCGMFAILLWAWYHYGKGMTCTKAWQTLVLLGGIGIILAGFLGVILYEQIPFLETVDALVTRRLSLSYQTLAEVGVSWFGSPIPEWHICDAGMVHMLIRWGIIPTAMFWAAMVALYLRALRTQNEYLQIVLLVFTVYVFMEGSLIDKVFRSIPLMHMPELLFKKE